MERTVVHNIHQCNNNNQFFFRIGSLKPGDILLAVNDDTLVNKTPFDAVDMLKNSGDMVTLTVRRERLSTFGK